MRIVFCCAALGGALALLTRPARADEICFAKDAVISRDIPKEVDIGYANMNDLTASKNRASPTVKMTGGKIAGAVFVWNRSALLVSAGTLANEVRGMDNSRIIFSGGITSGDLAAQENSVVEVRGGSVSQLFAKDHSTVNVRGGRINEIFVSDKATLNIYGVGLTKKVAETLGSGGGIVTRYTLSGRLADGTVLDSKMLLAVDNSGTKLNLINTPAAPSK